MSNTKICPYPGLRPFTEDESIYFKGREEHIEEIIGQLEEKKFVMLPFGFPSIIIQQIFIYIKIFFIKTDKRHPGWIFVFQ